MPSPVLRSARRVPALPALLAGLSAVALLLGGCAAFSDDSGSPDDGLQVTAAFYPLEYVVQRVAGDHADVTGLTATGDEPHDLELSVGETADVAEADLVVYERGFQPSVDAAVDENAQGELVDAAEVVDLASFREHGVDSDDVDPHFWLDPLLVAALGDAVADRLAEMDPAHAAEYAANAERLRADLEKVDQEYTAGLQGCARDTVVVSHDAFGYLTRYGLTMEAVLGLSPESEPTPAGLARLQDLIREEGITTVFSETLAPKETAEALAEDTGVRSDVLDPIEGLSDQTADEDYLSLMRANLAALAKANGC